MSLSHLSAIAAIFLAGSLFANPTISVDAFAESQSKPNHSLCLGSDWAK